MSPVTAERATAGSNLECSGEACRRPTVVIISVGEPLHAGSAAGSSFEETGRSRLGEVGLGQFGGIGIELGLDVDEGCGLEAGQCV